MFIFNPIYQSDDGSVYAVPGNSASMGGDIDSEGLTISHTLEDTVTVTQNGKSKSKSCSVKISITTMFPPEGISIIQMDEESNRIAKNDYTPGKLPVKLTPLKDTTYIIVESYRRNHDRNSLATRSLYDHNDESLDTFYTRGDGICVKQSTELNWNR